MIQKVQGEQPFQILASNFSIGPSSEGYTLQISADGDNYSNLFTVPANTTRMVTGVANGSFYRLSGNNSEVAINWRTQCKEGGGGGSYILPVASEDTLGGIKVGDGLDIDSEGVLSSEVNKLMAASEFPASAETGEVAAISISGDSGYLYGISVENRDFDGVQGKRFTIPVGCVDSLYEGSFYYIGKVGTEGTLYEMNISPAGDGEGGVNFTYEDPSDPLLAIFMNTGGEDEGEHISNDVNFNYHNDGSNFILDIYPDTGAVQSIVFEDVPEEGQLGVFQYDGTNWNKIGEGGIDSGAVETQILSHNYVTSADVETQISEKNYTTSGEVETQITNKNYITSAQGATLYASQDDMDFISGRTQTNERVLAEAVADIAETDAKFSAYTPTTGFSTINGSAITEGGNIEIQGGGDMDKLLPISGLPVSAEVGTMVSYSKPLGYWTRVNDGIEYDFTLEDLSGETMSSATIATISVPDAESVDIIITYSGGSWQYKNSPLADGEVLIVKDWFEDSVYYALRLQGLSPVLLKIYFASFPTKDLATITTFYEPEVGYKLYKYNGSEWEEDIDYTLPMATQNTLGGVIVGDYLQVDNDGVVSLDPDDMRREDLTFDSDLFKMGDEYNGDWQYFENNECGMAKVPLGYARTEVVISGMEYGTFLWVNSINEQFNFCSVDYLEGEGTPYVSLYDGTDDYILDMETEGTSAITCSIGVGNPDDYILYFEQTNEYKDIEGSTELVAIFTMKVYDAIQDRFLMITDGSVANLDEVSAGAYEDKLEWCEVVFAQAKKWFDEESGEEGKWVKYYNEDNINEVIADKVSSDTVAKIWRGTLAEYTAITPKDPSTLYIIIPNSGE